MAHCTKCGAEIPETAQFCQKCGQPQAAAPPNPGFRPPSPPYQPATTGLSENAAATLSYVLGWLTGIIFYLIDSRPYVRFHAAQSIVTFGGLNIIHKVVGNHVRIWLGVRRIQPVRRRWPLRRLWYRNNAVEPDRLA